MRRPSSFSAGSSGAKFSASVPGGRSTLAAMLCIEISTGALSDRCSSCTAAVSGSEPGASPR